VVPGGVRLTDLTPLMVSRIQTAGRAAFLALADALVPVAGQYDLVVVDSPPENVMLVDLVLGAARWVLMPTRSDRGGLVGMRLVAERFSIAREINPSLGLLGVVLFGTLAGARAIHAEVRADVVAAFGGTVDATRDDKFSEPTHFMLDLAATNLDGANLRDANLARVSLYRAFMYGADLSDADLTRAHLGKADLSRADLTDADLFGADLTCAKTDDHAAACGGGAASAV
jgi:cellulose biosynthesis protein BcsQ